MTVVEFWVEQYQAVVVEKKALGDKLRETLEENKKLQERLDKSIADRSELQADRDIWFRKNGEKQAEIEELKKQLEEIKQEFKQSYADGYSDGNEEGQNELWEMLQLVRDMQPNEFDVECECLGDVIDMDLEDFKEAYGKWEAEQKKVAEEAKKQHVDYMRDYLKRYCIGKLCFGCPLYDTSKPVSSCLFSKLTDEEIEERYRKLIENDGKVRAADDPCSGVREKVKETCDAFAEGLKAALASEVKEVPVSVDIPIKDLASWECTIEATVEVNKDLLEKVCGIKDDKK